MSIAKRVLRFWFPPSPWKVCNPPTEAERLAAFEIRMGEWKAAQRLRDARVQQLVDMHNVVRAKFEPKLPA